jgi:hypothetical protein
MCFVVAASATARDFAQGCTRVGAEADNAGALFIGTGAPNFCGFYREAPVAERSGARAARKTPCPARR